MQPLSLEKPKDVKPTNKNNNETISHNIKKEEIKKPPVPHFTPANKDKAKVE